MMIHAVVVGRSGAVPQSTVVHQSAVPAAARPTALSPAPIFWIPNGGSGWISFDPIEGGQIIIPVVLNGESVRALVDTGFDRLVISKAFADAHQLPLTPWGKAVNFGGPTQYYFTPDVRLDIGAIRTTKAGVVAVTDVPDLLDAGIGRFDVVIGLALLGKVEWEIDQDQHRIRMLKGGAIPIDGGVAVRIGPANSRLVTDVDINGKRVSPAMIDTGSDDEVSLPTSTARELDFHGQTDMEAEGIGGSVVQPIGRLTDFRIGGQTMSGAYASIGGSGWFDLQGIGALVGMGVLKNYNLVVDPGAGKMVLNPRFSTPALMAKSTSGVQGPYYDGRLTITHVMKNSPAVAAGLKNGDQICAIDGKPMSQDMVDRHWGRAAPGTRYSLTLCDGSKRAITLRSFY